MHEHVGGIGINTEGAGALEFFLRVAAAEEAYGKSAFAAGSEYVPDTIAGHDAVGDGYFEAAGGQDKNIRGGFGIGNVVSSDDSCFSGNAQIFQEALRLLSYHRWWQLPT